jgi:hypothetical protein
MPLGVEALALIWSGIASPFRRTCLTSDNHYLVFVVQKKAMMILLCGFGNMPSILECVRGTEAL